MVAQLVPAVAAREVSLKTMTKTFYIVIALMVANPMFSQQSLDDLLKSHNTKNIPYISVQELAMPKTDAIILDARELKEFEISHIKNAIHVGFNHFNKNSIKNIINDKNKPIVVYCSVGIRSETIAHKLKKAGYNNVFNLYGGIFEWKNKGFKVYNSKEQETENIHTFNKKWSLWLKKGIKIYD